MSEATHTLSYTGGIVNNGERDGMDTDPNPYKEGTAYFCDYHFGLIIAQIITLEGESEQ